MALIRYCHVQFCINGEREERAWDEIPFWLSGKREKKYKKVK